jgi:tetratricopeptide (TPR) repeat protein
MAGQHDRALGCHRRATRLDPQNADGLAVLATVCRRLGRNSEALEAIRAACRLDPQAGAYHGLLGEILRDGGQLIEAEAAFAQAVELEPDELAHVNGLADVRTRLGAMDGARALLEQAVSDGPDAHTCLHLAEVHSLQAESQRAAELAAQALALDPQAPDIVLRSAAILRTAGRAELALQAVQSCLGDHADDARLHHEHGLALESLGQHEAALEAFQNASRLSDQGDIARSLGALAVRAGRPDLAIPALERCLDCAPVSATGDRAAIHHLLGMAHAAAGDPQAAASAYMQASHLSPYQVAYALDAATAASANGDHDSAIGVLEEALIAHGDAAELHAVLGRSFEARGWSGEALAAYSRAVELDPAQAEYHRSRARLLAESAPAEAIDALGRAVAIDPDDAETYHHLGQAYVRLGEYRLAAQQFERATRLSPSPIYRLALAGALTRLGDPNAQAELKALAASQLDDAWLCLELARLQVAGGQLTDAMATYMRAVQLDPEFGEAWRELGLLQLVQADAASAVEALAKAVRIAPDDSHARQALGMALSALGEQDGAQQASEAALSLLAAARDLAEAGPGPSVQAESNRLGPLSADGSVPQSGVPAVGPHTEAHVTPVALAESSTAADLGVDNSVPQATRTDERGDAPSAATEQVPATDRPSAQVGLEADADTASALRLAQSLVVASWPAPLICSPEPLDSESEATASAAIGTVLQAGGSNSARAWELMGLLHGRQGRCDEGIQAVQQALALQPERASVHRTLAWLLCESGRLDDALESLSAARALEEGAPEAHYLIGRAHELLGDLGVAAYAVRSAAALLPDVAPAHAEVGRTLLRLRDAQGAVSAMRRACELEPQTAEYHQALGSALLAAGSSDEAVAAYASAIECASDLPQAQHELAMAFREIGDLASAAEKLECALNLAEGRPGEALWRAELAAIYHGLGNLTAAVHSSGVACQPEPENAAHWLQQACVYLESGQLDEAETAARNALQLDPELAEAHAVLGDVYLARHQAEDAHRAYTRAVALDSGQAGYRFRLGTAARAVGNLDEAMTQFETAARLEPDNAEACVAVGRVFAEEGYHDEAMQILQQAVVSRPDHAGAHLELGRLCAMMGYVDKAEAHLERALDLQADCAPAHVELAALYAADGRFEAAVAAYVRAIEHGAGADIALQAAELYKQLGQFGRAADMIERACQLQPRSAQAYAQLAHARALSLFDRATNGHTDQHEAEQ